MGIIQFLVLSLLLFSAVQGLMIGLFMFVRNRGNRLANVALGFLLFTFGLSALDVWLLRVQWFENALHVYHLPFWFTLSFGPLFFYHVKFSLFPIYQFRPTDFKHLILPVMQFVLVFSIGLQAPENQYQISQDFIRPYYGPIEYALFLVFLFVHLSLAYRYVRYQNARLRHKGQEWEKKKAFLLRKTVKRLSLLGGVYSFFALVDFIAYRFFNINLYDAPGFSFFGDIAFAGMLLWLGYTVFREDIQLFLETRQLKPQSDLSALVEGLETTLQQGQLLSNPELGTLHLAKAAACAGKYIRESVWQHRNYRVSTWIQEHRVKMAQQMLRINADMHHIAIAAGFNSTHQLIKVLQQKSKNSK